MSFNRASRDALIMPQIAMLMTYDGARNVRFEFAPDEGDPVALTHLRAWAVLTGGERPVVAAERIALDHDRPAPAEGMAGELSWSGEIGGKDVRGSFPAVTLLATAECSSLTSFGRSLFVFGPADDNARRFAGDVTARWLAHRIAGGEMFEPLAASKPAEAEADG